MTATLPDLTETAGSASFRTAQDVRWWCPGCGNHAILAAAQAFLAGSGIPAEKMVIVSGIGCSSRFPYYVNTYGIHSIHGRAPAIATGIAINRPDLTVWVVTGDGDALSIGGNHLIHALRRNVNIKILLFNNRIYGLTKGQYSPTSEPGKVTKSTPEGSLDEPFNPVSLALGAGASFVARTIDTDRKHLTATLQAAAAHHGTTLVEIYQNCPVFNDGAYRALKDPCTSRDWLIRLEHGKPIVFGSDERSAVVRDPDSAQLRIGDAGDPTVVVHDATSQNRAYAFALAELAQHDLRHTAIGVFRALSRPSYDSRFRSQLAAAVEGNSIGLQQLLTGPDSWTVE